MFDDDFGMVFDAGLGESPHETEHGKMDSAHPDRAAVEDISRRMRDAHAKGDHKAHADAVEDLLELSRGGSPAYDKSGY